MDKPIYKRLELLAPGGILISTRNKTLHICSVCEAVVSDRDVHTMFHDYIENLNYKKEAIND